MPKRARIHYEKESAHGNYYRIELYNSATEHDWIHEDLMFASEEILSGLMSMKNTIVYLKKKYLEAVLNEIPLLLTKKA